jgi:hypothetical protein
MTLSKATIIGITALLAIPAVFAAPTVTAGGFDTCTAVSFDTFKANSVKEKEPQFGPKGLYSSSTTGECIYVDAAADGDFAMTHPADYEGFIANTHILLSKIPEAAADFEYLSAVPVQERSTVTPRGAEMMARQTVGCGAVCNFSQVRSGRTGYQQSLLMFFPGALTGFATAERADTPVLFASPEGAAPPTPGANRYQPNDAHQ